MTLNTMEKMFNIKYVGPWRLNATYMKNDVVLGADSLLYVALNNNVNKVVSTAANWKALDTFFADNYTAAKALVRAGRHN